MQANYTVSTAVGRLRKRDPLCEIRRELLLIHPTQPAPLVLRSNWADCGGHGTGCALGIACTGLRNGEIREPRWQDDADGSHCDRVINGSSKRWWLGKRRVNENYFQRLIADGQPRTAAEPLGSWTYVKCKSADCTQV